MYLDTQFPVGEVLLVGDAGERFEAVLCVGEVDVLFPFERFALGSKSIDGGVI